MINQTQLSMGSPLLTEAGSLRSSGIPNGVHLAGKRGGVKNGFTLIELLVAMVIIALLLSIVAPRYFNSVSKAEEAVLKEDLTLMRDALDKYHADNGQYPDTLDDLVSKKYLRKIPIDPISQSSTTWIVIPPSNSEKGAVFDIKSGAEGNARDGSAYSDW